MVLFGMVSRTLQALLLCGLVGAPALPWPHRNPDRRVFDDRDGDGMQGRDEAGVAGVALSNGRDLVRSDRDGAYLLSTQPDKPSS